MKLKSIENQKILKGLPNTAKVIYLMDTTGVGTVYASEYLSTFWYLVLFVFFLCDV